jgi:hypothetical protein
MKKIFIISMLAALFLSACDNSSNSSNDLAYLMSNTSNSTISNNNTSDFNLTFDANYPFNTDKSVNKNTGEITYASEFTENGKTFYYEPTYSGKQEAKKGGSITLEKSTTYNYSFSWSATENGSGKYLTISNSNISSFSPTITLSVIDVKLQNNVRK